MDDKAVVPVGDPGMPLSTGVRPHNRVLAPTEGPELVAMDHDLCINGLVPFFLNAVCSLICTMKLSKKKVPTRPILQNPKSKYYIFLISFFKKKSLCLYEF